MVDLTGCKEETKECISILECFHFCDDRKLHFKYNPDNDQFSVYELNSWYVIDEDTWQERFETLKIDFRVEGVDDNGIRR